MELDFDKMNGLVPAIIQDNETRKVLMLGFMNKEAYDKTVETGKVTFFSRTKNRLWTKGEESGNRQKIFEILLDCDGDSVIYKVEQKGNIACHTGHRSCFYRSWDGKDWKENAPVLKSPEEMYGKGHH